MGSTIDHGPAAPGAGHRRRPPPQGLDARSVEQRQHDADPGHIRACGWIKRTDLLHLKLFDCPHRERRCGGIRRCQPNHADRCDEPGTSPSSKSTTAPSVTTSVPGTLLVGVFGSAAKATVTPPTGMIEQAERLAGTGTLAASPNRDQQTQTVEATGARGHPHQGRVERGSTASSAAIVASLRADRGGISVHVNESGDWENSAGQRHGMGGPAGRTPMLSL